MKAGRFVTGHLMLLIACSYPNCMDGAEPFPLSIKPSGPRLELSWPTTMTNAEQGVVFPAYVIQYSTDLVEWQPLGGKVRGLSAVSGPTLILSLEKQPGQIFYRISADPNSQEPNQLGRGGAEVFGYNAQFGAELARLGLLPVESFATNAANVWYLPQLTWDPTTAQFWTNFNS